MSSGSDETQALQMSISNYPSIKRLLRRRLLAAANVQRIHIIGCSRSGTSMFQLSLQAFQRVSMCTRESNVTFFPTLKESVGMMLSRQPCMQYYVTKRDSKWYEPVAVEQLRRACALERVGLIHLVRDPRDVMTSRHKGAGKEADHPAFYVSEQHWVRSVESAETLLADVLPYTPVATLRYEDVVLNPQAGIEILHSTFGLEMREDVQSWR